MSVTIEKVRHLSEAALRAHGAGAVQAASVARAVARAEAVGNVICGLYYLESYCLQLRSGRVRGQAVPRVSRPRPGAVKVDAGFGFAQPAFDAGLGEAVAAARTNAVATLAVAHAHTCTALGYFTERIGAEGLIGLGFTNASPVVAPPGGARPVIGTNPIALTVPGPTRDPDRPLLQFDFSTSAVALGKITMAKAAGIPIPAGWAVDADGRPTTDPDAALQGALVSAGGHKGWGFGLMAEVMAACLTGSVNSLDVSGLKAAEGPPHDLGQLYILIDPATHTDEFAARFARLADAVADQDGARLPGTRRVIREAVALDPDLWARVQALAGT
ncbi:MAG: Ldh family oxidoreductase [Rubellimicrobium sp.]|nr:Ldh family oxidoreductase [Rubellimicrobium sp.]